MVTKDDFNTIGGGCGPSDAHMGAYQKVREEFLDNFQKHINKEKRELMFIRVMLFLFYLVLSFFASISIRHIFDLSPDKMLWVFDLFIFIPPIILTLTCFYGDVFL